MKEFSKYFDFKTNDKYYQNKRGLGYRQYLNSVKEKSNNACSLIIQENARLQKENEELKKKLKLTFNCPEPDSAVLS